jgi:hypothetical protein
MLWLLRGISILRQRTKRKGQRESVKGGPLLAVHLPLTQGSRPKAKTAKRNSGRFFHVSLSARWRSDFAFFCVGVMLDGVPEVIVNPVEGASLRVHLSEPLRVIVDFAVSSLAETMR